MDVKQLIEKAEGLLELAEKENRALTDEEQAQYDKLMADIDAAKRMQERRAAVNAAKGWANEAQHEPLAKREQPGTSDIGMSDKETREYSLTRAIRAAATGNWRGAELEREASEATAAKLGRDPQGFFVPTDFMKRDLTVGTATAGGNLVATDLLSQSFIDLLRNRMVVRRAGATVLTDLVGDIAIPRQTGGATGYWVAESGAPTESQQTIDQVAMSPKTVGAYTDYSRKLLKQSSVSVEQFVRNDLANVLALAIDLAALHGTGSSNQPTGIASTTGIGSVAGGTDGAAPTWANIVQLETEVAQDNADIGKLAYITNAKVRGKLKQTEKASGTAQFIWGDGNAPVNGYNAMVSNQVSSTLTKGTSVGVCSAIFFGNWADLIIGMWGGLDILVDPYTGGTSGTVRVIAMQDVDIAVRHAESFAAMLDALTA